MAGAFDIVRIAAGEIGTVESPSGSNRVKYAKWYGMNGQPWCAMFVSWVFAQAELLNACGGKFAYCPYWGLTTSQFVTAPKPTASMLTRP